MNSGWLQGRRRLPGVLAVLVLGLMFACPITLRAQGLSSGDFRQIGSQGMGDSANSYCWSLKEYKGKIYFGSNRHFMCLSRSAARSTDSIPPEFPLECEENSLDMDLRARLWCYDPATGRIELVYISPTIEVLMSDGTIATSARDLGYRTMAVFKEADGTEALYVGTFTSRKLPGPPARILRTTDGRNFEEIITPFSDNDVFKSYRSMEIYKGKLYATIIGQSAADNLLVESADPQSGDFRIVPIDGPNNLGASGPYTLEVFKGYLYISVSFEGKSEGFRLIKTQANGNSPYSFQTVLTDGAYRGPQSESLVSMGVYGEHLYVGSGLFGGFRVLPNEVGPAGAELLRVDAADNWDLIVGDARETPDGYKAPLSGQRAGFNNSFTGYIWQIAEHDGVLYVGTFDKSFTAQYAEGITLDSIDSASARESIVNLDEIPIDIAPDANLDEIFDLISAIEGGFDIWTTTDGTNWARVTRSGFGNEFDYGVRRFLSTSYGLFVGTANPFFGFQLYVGQYPGTDSDGDTRPDAVDNCPLVWNLNQMDLDKDGIGDLCDNDSDNDCIPNSEDPQPSIPDESSPDTDNDGIPNPCDIDDDNDSVLDHQDNCPLVSNFNQIDSDGNGVGDACQPAAPSNTPPPPPPIQNNDDDEPDEVAGEEPPAGPPPGCGGGVPALLTGTLLLLCISGGSRRKTRRFVRDR